MTVCGIDVGKKGALAFIDEFRECYSYPMPMIGDEIDIEKMFALIKHHQTKKIYIEKAQAMPGQGVSSMFNYGYGFGMIVATVYLTRIPFTLVPPRTWTKEIHKGITGDLEAKEKSLLAIRRLFPNAELTPGKKRVPHDGIIDALLIAEYGRRQS